MALRPLYRRLRGSWHRAHSAARGGGGVLVRAAAGWRVPVHPEGWEDLKYWLRYEQPTMAALTRVLRPGMQVLDVGAHHGVFSLCCCARGHAASRIVTVEPSPAAWPLLEKNRSVCASIPWAQVPVAAGAARGELTLHTGFVDMLVIDNHLHPGTEDAVVQVKVETLDSICERLGLGPDLVKLDVEGYEAEALAGSTAMLARHRPILILEWHCAMLRRRGLDPVAALGPLLAGGYVFEAYEHPEIQAFTADRIAHLPASDIYRLVCTPEAR
jgi:FkbM family methyltransferase